jgi:hypothetical protein
MPGLGRRLKNGGNKMSQPDDLAVFDTMAAAAFTGLARATLAKLRCIGGGPEYLKLGRKVVYRRVDLANWLNLRRVANTTQAIISLPRRLTDTCSKAAERSAGK